ncbi:MAG: hypothetical protein LBH37_05035 [Oscillospiraceae bacterium]|jgi:hypothetical protein|nr:hypothetical protein [Oscillospiraceae bacterium]
MGATLEEVIHEDDKGRFIDSVDEIVVPERIFHYLASFEQVGLIAEYCSIKKISDDAFKNFSRVVGIL